jgi:hypothetical protein
MHAPMMANMQPASERTAERAMLCNSTVVLLVGNIEASTQWYQRIATIFHPVLASTAVMPSRSSSSGMMAKSNATILRLASEAHGTCISKQPTWTPSFKNSRGYMT